MRAIKLSVQTVGLQIEKANSLSIERSSISNNSGLGQRLFSFIKDKSASQMQRSKEPIWLARAIGSRPLL